MNLAGSPPIVFRADASLEIGTGHVMRCLTLANELTARGAVCEFVCRNLPGHQFPEVSRRGFRVHALGESGFGGVAATSREKERPAGYTAWLGGVSSAVDAEQTLAVLAGRPVDWLVVDHYALDRQWEEKLRAGASQIMVIDDLVNRSHDCDLLLNQNLGSQASDYHGLVPDSCKLLCGPEYALLRPEFAQLRPRSLERRSDRTLSRILVSMGGVDKDNATGRVLDALGACNLPNDVMVTVILGSHAPWIERIRQQAETLRFPVKIMVDVANMAELMADSDFAIGAAGSTSWERCCIGLPGALVILAENQAELCRELVTAGAAFELGTPADISQALPPLLDALHREPHCLAEMSAAAATICDGLGVERAASALLAAHSRAGMCAAG